MGCAGSTPKADTFLADDQPAPANGYMFDGLAAGGGPMGAPAVVMKAWSNFDPGKKYHVGGGMMGGLTQVNVAFAQHLDDNQAFDDGSKLEDAVGDAGTGPPEALPITVDGASTPVAVMSMPPHMSFGQASALRDSAGQIIALITTAQSSRPTGWNASSVNVWGTKPVPGQAASVIGGMQVYLWARADRKPFSNKFTFFDGAGAQLGTGTSIAGWALQYKIMNLTGSGIMLATFTAGSNKKTFDIQCAKGVDVTLAICMMAAMQVGRDELKVEAQSSTGNADPGDD